MTNAFNPGDLVYVLQIVCGEVTAEMKARRLAVPITMTHVRARVLHQGPAEITVRFVGSAEARTVPAKLVTPCPPPLT